MSTRRPDNRSQGELRPITISFDGLAGVDGSARFAFDTTKALASVSGPTEVRLASEQAPKATFEVIMRPLAGIAGTESKATAASLRAALTSSIILTANPRTLIQLVVQSLTPSVSTSLRSNNGSTIRSNPSLTAALINASSLALLNTASFPMHGVVCSAAIGRLRDSRTLIVDPSDEELPSLDGGGVFAFMFSDALEENHDTKSSSASNAQSVWSQWNAVPFTEDEFILASSLAKEASKNILNTFREAIGNSLTGTRIFEEPRVGVKKELPNTQARLSDAMVIA